MIRKQVIQNTILISLFIVIGVAGEAQKKMDGIGPFRLNQFRTSQLDSIRSNSTVSEIVIEGDEVLRTFDAPWVSEHKVFKVANLTIAGMLFKRIQLDFYKDTLYKIEVNEMPDDFRENINLKYGAPELQKTSKKITCSSKYGEYTEEEVSYTSDYGTREIPFSYFMSAYFDSKCEKQLIQFFLGYVLNKEILVSRLESEAKERIKSDRNKEKLKALNGL